MKRSRPLSPHIGIYDAQMTSGMSLAHRFTGIGLAGGMILLVVWLVCLAWGEEPFAFLMHILKTPVGQYILFGLTWALFFHMACGVRHLLWDFGVGFSLRAIYGSAYAAILFSLAATALFWSLIGCG